MKKTVVLTQIFQQIFFKCSPEPIRERYQVYLIASPVEQRE